MFQGQENVEIILKPDDYRFRGTIQYVTDRHIVVACPPADAVHCVEGAHVALAQVVEGLFYQFETEIVRCQKNSFVAPLLPPQVLQRRRSPRAMCQIAATYTHLNPRSVGSQPVEETEKQAQIQDISTGGAKTYTSEVLIANTVVRLSADIGEEGKVEAEATVLRCVKRESKALHNHPDLPYQTTFRFTALARVDAMLLTRYIQIQVKAGATMRESYAPRTADDKAA